MYVAVIITAIKMSNIIKLEQIAILLISQALNRSCGLLSNHEKQTKEQKMTMILMCKCLAS